MTSLEPQVVGRLLFEFCRYFYFIVFFLPDVSICSRFFCYGNFRVPERPSFLKTLFFPEHNFLGGQFSAPGEFFFILFILVEFYFFQICLPKTRVFEVASCYLYGVIKYEKIKGKSSAGIFFRRHFIVYGIK